MIKKIILAAFCCGLAVSALPVMAQSVAGDSTRQLQMENERIARQIDSLQKIAAEVNDRLVFEDSLQRKTGGEINISEASPRLRLYRHRIDSLNASFRLESRIKDTLHHRFDSLLMPLDSLMGLQNQVRERIKARGNP